MSLIKPPADLKLLRIAGKKLGDVLRLGEEKAKAGMTLLELDAILHQAITDEGGKPLFIGFEGYPNASCLSVNDQVVHGIPSDYIMRDGDIVGIDLGLWLGHVCVDAARTIAIGQISPKAAHLLEATQVALKAGINAAKPFRRVGAISQSVQDSAELNGLGIVRALTGHGVGHHMHEEPEVPNYGRASDGILLRPGMVLAIEPMLTTGGGEIVTADDGWTVSTADGSLAAQFEQTIIITPRGHEVITA